MKKKLLLGSAVAIGGSLLAISSAFALYLVKPEDKTINIGINTNTDANLTISDIADGDNTKALSPANEKNYTFSLGAEKPSGSTYTQTVAVADLKIVIDFKTAGITDKVESSIELGYTAGKYFAIDANNLNKATSTVSGNTLVIEKTNVAFNLGGLGVALNLKLKSSVSAADFLTSVSSKEYTITVNWTENTTYQYPYVVGTMNNWAETDAYRMVPNIEADNAYEFMLNSSLEIKAGEKFKCRKGDVWSSGEDYAVQTGKKVTAVYWKGGAGDALSAQSVDA